MTFGIGKITFTELYDASNERTISYTGGPNKDGKFHLTALPSDGALWEPQQIHHIEDGVTYEITGLGNVDNDTKKGAISGASNLSAAADVVVGAVFTGNTDDIELSANGVYFMGRILSSTATNFQTLQKGVTYEYTSNSSGGTALTSTEIATIVTNSTLNSASELVAGARFTMKASLDETGSGLNGKNFNAQVVSPTSVLTDKIEGIQAKINTARVQAGSQYAALESAVAYTTDLTAQYELGFNTVNDVNFSMETAHLAKNQILQQAATAMLAQANSGQQGLLQLLQ